jgi:hypothetical protein
VAERIAKGRVSLPISSWSADDFLAWVMNLAPVFERYRKILRDEQIEGKDLVKKRYNVENLVGIGFQEVHAKKIMERIDEKLTQVVKSFLVGVSPNYEKYARTFYIKGVEEPKDILEQKLDEKVLCAWGIKEVHAKEIIRAARQLFPSTIQISSQEQHVPKKWTF